MKKRSIFIAVFTVLFLFTNIAFAQEGISKEISQQKKVGTVDHIYKFSEDLARFEVDGKWGYMDKKGNIIIEPKFDFAFDFRRDLARVIVDNKYGFIDKKGEYFLKPTIDANKYYIGDLDNGFAKIYKDAKVAFINEKGEIICDFEYYNSNDTRAITDNLIVVIKREIKKAESLGVYDTGERYEHTDKFGLIDSKGKEVLEPIYDDIDVYREVYRDQKITHTYNDLIEVRLDGKYGLVDAKGNVLLDYESSWTTPETKKKLEDLKSKYKPEIIDWSASNYSSKNKIIPKQCNTTPKVDVKRYENMTARFVGKNGKPISNEVFTFIELIQNPYGDYFYQCTVHENDKEYFYIYGLDGKRLINKKYSKFKYELHYQSNDRYFTIASGRTDNGEVDIIDIYGDINIVKTLKGTIYNLVKSDEFISYAVIDNVAEGTLVNIIIDFDGNEIGRFTNNYEHYYSWNGLINYIDFALYGERPSWTDGIGSLQNYTYTKYKKGNTLEKDCEELNKVLKTGIWSAGYVIAKDGKLNYGSTSYGRSILNDTVEITSWDNKPAVAIAGWAIDDGEEGYTRDNMLVMNVTMEAFKYYSKNDKDAEELWSYIDNHIKQGRYPVTMGQSMVKQFGDTKVKLYRDEYRDRVLNVIFID